MLILLKFVLISDFEIKMAFKAIGKDEEGPDCLIIAGVLDGVKQSFIDSGVDPEVLYKLRDLWVTKLRNKKVKDERRERTAKQQMYDSVRKNIDASDKKIGSDENSSDVDEVVVSDLDTESKDWRRKNIRMIQVDGLVDSSDDDDAGDDEEEGDDDGDDDDELDPDGEEEEGIEDEPLGSDDDIPDEDASELFETDNVMVCQYDKVTRARNKWKFHLKVHLL